MYFDTRFEYFKKGVKSIVSLKSILYNTLMSVQFSIFFVENIEILIHPAYQDVRFFKYLVPYFTHDM